MGAFDDLIPAPATSRGVFSDLVPDQAPGNEDFDSHVNWTRMKFPNLTKPEAIRMVAEKFKRNIPDDPTAFEAFKDTVSELPGEAAKGFARSAVVAPLRFVSRLGDQFTQDSAATVHQHTPGPIERVANAGDAALEIAFPTPENPGLEHAIAQGTGQLGSMFTGGAALKAMGAGAKLIGAGVVTQGAVNEFDDAFGRAVELGADADTAFAKSLGYATIAGLIENRLGAGRLWRQMFPSVELAAKKLTALGVSKTVAANILAGGLEEGSQRFAQNLIVEEKPSFEGVMDEAIPGAIIEGAAGIPTGISENLAQHAAYQEEQHDQRLLEQSGQRVALEASMPIANGKLTANRAADESFVKGAFDDLIPDKTISQSQTAVAPVNSEAGKNQTPAAAQATSPAAGASQQAQVRTELAALPGAEEDLANVQSPTSKVPKLTAEQTDAGLRERSTADDAAPVTKGDLKALVNFFQNGGPNPFAQQDQPKTTNSETGNEPNIQANPAQPAPGNGQKVAQTQVLPQTPQGNAPSAVKPDFVAPETPAATKIEIKNGDTVSVVTRAGEKPRAARVLQLQPDGSAQVVVAGEQTARWLSADQITPSRRAVTQQAKADELAGFAPEQQTQIKERAAEFRQLVEDYAPQLEWTPAEAYDESFGTDTKDVGFRKAELRTNAIRQAMRAVFPNGQENSQVDQANALPALERYLKEQFPGDNSVAKRRALEQFSRSETSPEQTATVERDQATLDDIAARRPNKSEFQGLRAVGRSVSPGQLPIRQRGTRSGVLSSAGASTLSELERIFGVRIIFVENARFNGVRINGTNLVLINAKSPRATMAIAGHELLHHIKATHPGLYADFVAQARALLKNSEQFRSELAAKGYTNISDALVEEEMFADVLGDAVLDPAFLQQLAKSEPNLFKRFARTAVKWLEKLIAKAKALAGFDSAQYVTDMEAMRHELLNLLRDAGRQTQFERGGIQQEATEDTEQGQDAFSKLDRVRIGSVDTAAQGVLNQARELKSATWKRVQSLRQQIKDRPLGAGNLRLDLMRAEDAHREALRMEQGAKEAIEKRANEQGQTTLANPSDQGGLFGAPESVEEQRARLKAEAETQKLKKAKEAMQERAGARLVGKDLDTTQEMFGGGVKRDKSGQGDMFSLEKNQFPERFVLAKPIKGPTGASIVGYEWRSTMGEKYSAREGGMVEARVSDWDNADESTGTGRSIVHVFYVEHPNGKVHPEGIRSAQTVLGINESRLMTIAKKERAAQQYRQDQERTEMANYDKSAAATAQEAARDYRKVNYSPMRTFEENNDGFNESALFEKNGKFIRRNWKAAERMQRNGWTLVKDDPARTGGTAKAIDAVRATEPESQHSGGLPQEITDAVRDWRGAEKRYRRARRQEPSDVEDAQDAREESEINFRMLAQKHNITQAQFDELNASAKATDTEQMVDMFSLPKPEEQSEFTKLQADITAAEAELMTAIRQHMNPPEGMRKAEALEAKNDAHRKLRDLLRQQLKLMTDIRNLDAARSPEETANLISQTVDLLNSIQDDISERNAKSEAVPADLTKLRTDLQERLAMLKGWTDNQEDEARSGKVEKATESSRARFLALESATDPQHKTFGEWWQTIKNGLRYLTSPIPELPLRGERAEKSALFRRGYRLFAVENNRVRKEAAERVNQVLEPLTRLGRTPASNEALRRYYQLGEARERAAMDEPKRAAIAKQMLALEESTLNKDPFNLFRRLVLYKDLRWRGTYLKNDAGKPITLPMGLTVDEVASELRRTYKLIENHPDGLAITEALRRHYKLTDDLQKSILEHGEIIPESLRNPLYFPHHVIDSWSGNIARVRPSTEEDFRKYLIAPAGSAKLIQTDYLKAMYLHTADVLAHNARVDLVDKYWKPYDISEQLKAQHGDKWNLPWNIPPGYKIFTPFNKLPLRMDYVLSREVLADKLGVLFNDGDLRERMGDTGKVLKVKPEDLHAAMVAGEKIQWVLPAEIADALNGIARREAAASNPGLGHAIGLPFRAVNNFWKKTKLFAPWNWVRYEYGNLSTDAIDKVLAADPGAAKHLARAAREVWTADTGKQSPEYQAAQREGVFDTITAGEAGELTKLPEFKAFLTGSEARWEKVRSFLERPMRGSKFREATFRYAKFLADVERLRAGKEPTYAGAFHGDIEALGEDVDGQRRMLEGDELIYAKASEISLKTYGDYSGISVFGQWLRQYAVPFWSWQDVNFRYHANQLRNIADGLLGKTGPELNTARKAALRYAGVRVVSTLVAIGIAKELWNQFGGPMLGLWDDDDDLESKLSEADRRRGHLIMGKDKDGKVLVVYTPSAWSDVAEWMGGQNMKRLFMEYARGQITLDQFVKDYAKQMPADVLNKIGQSFGPLGKSFYETISGKSTFPDVLDQRNIPAADKWWRLVGTLTDDRAVNVLRAAFDKDYYSQPASEQLQQIILQIRRRDPEQWAYYEVREDAADWKLKKTGKDFEHGSYNAPEAQALRSFRKAIYQGDVAQAEHFYNRLIEYGYTAERLDASIRNQHPLADLNPEERKAFVAGLTVGQQRELDLATKYYNRMKMMDGREKQLFPSKLNPSRSPNPELLQRLMENQSRNK